MNQNKSNNIFILIPQGKHFTFAQFYSINVYKFGRSDRMRFRTKNRMCDENQSVNKERT